MSNQNEQQSSFESVKARLAEIAEAVDDEELSLDDALDLYEEAVALGLQASDLLETSIALPEEALEPEGAAGDETFGASDGARGQAQTQTQVASLDSTQSSEADVAIAAEAQPSPTAD